MSLLFVRYISQPRFNVYLNHCQNNKVQALKLYKVNLTISESTYPMLALIEISLRNLIHEKLQQHFNDPYWFNKLPNEFLPFIHQAELKIISQQKSITPDRIISELSFGFWNRLFNKRYAHQLWKPLRTVFSNMPKSIRKRDTIEESLFRIRRFRNRVYHYEPIFRKVDMLESTYNDMIQLIQWMDADLLKFIEDINRFDDALQRLKMSTS